MKRNPFPWKSTIFREFFRLPFAGNLLKTAVAGKLRKKLENVYMNCKRFVCLYDCHNFRNNICKYIGKWKIEKQRECVSVCKREISLLREVSEQPLHSNNANPKPINQRASYRCQQSTSKVICFTFPRLLGKFRKIWENALK